MEPDKIYGLSYPETNQKANKSVYLVLCNNEHHKHSFVTGHCARGASYDNGCDRGTDNMQEI